MACNCKGVLPVELTLGAISVGFANGQKGSEDVILQKLRKIIYTKKYDSPEEQMESSDAFFILILFILIAVGFFIDRLM